jgi:hypothetical protein
MPVRRTTAFRQGVWCADASAVQHLSEIGILLHFSDLVGQLLIPDLVLPALGASERDEVERAATSGVAPIAIEPITFSDSLSSMMARLAADPPQLGRATYAAIALCHARKRLRFLTHDRHAFEQARKHLGTRCAMVLAVVKDLRRCRKLPLLQYRAWVALCS